MARCPYKSILAFTLNKTPLLPISPNAYFGTVMHKVLERIHKEGIADEVVFNLAFDEEITAMEAKLKHDGYSFFTPLQDNVQDFGMRKILLKRHLRKSTEPGRKNSGCKSDSEQWIATKDKLIGGFVDLIIESDSYVELADFKTGAVTQDILDDSGELLTEIKPEYKDQLKLYAQAYFETKGRYPDKLTLIDLTGQKFDVTFTQKECSELAAQAKILLKEVNDSVQTVKFKSVISDENCKSCLYRPACKDYNAYLETNASPVDLSGLLENVIRYQNGNITLFIRNGMGLYTVSGIVNTDYKELQSRIGNKMGVYNLKKESKENVYSSRKTTVIYER